MDVSTARHLLRRIGRRGACLLFLATLDIAWGFGLAWAPPETRSSPGMVFAAQILPLSGWTAIWTTAGALCLVQAFMRTDWYAFAAASLVVVAWASVYLLGWTLGEVPRGWLTALIWLEFAAFVQVIAGWRENSPIT